MAQPRHLSRDSVAEAKCFSLQDCPACILTESAYAVVEPFIYTTEAKTRAGRTVDGGGDAEGARCPACGCTLGCDQGVAPTMRVEMPKGRTPPDCVYFCCTPAM